MKKPMTLYRFDGGGAFTETWRLTRNDEGYRVVKESGGYMRRWLMDPWEVQTYKLPEGWHRLPRPVQEAIKRKKPWLASKCMGITFDETGKRIAG